MPSTGPPKAPASVPTMNVAPSSADSNTFFTRFFFIVATPFRYYDCFLASSISLKVHFKSIGVAKKFPPRLERLHRSGSGRWREHENQKQRPDGSSVCQSGRCCMSKSPVLDVLGVGLKVGQSDSRTTGTARRGCRERANPVIGECKKASDMLYCSRRSMVGSPFTGR